MTQADSVHSTPPLNTSATDDDLQLYRRTDISPEDFFQALGRVRRDARDEIERLIEWLDTTIDCDEDTAVDDTGCDGDPDTEPSLGSFDRMSNQIKAWQTTWDCSADIDVEIDTCDDEPSLGAAEPDRDGRDIDRWNEGTTDDREGDGCADDREGDELQHGGDAVLENDEPSLGWTEEEAGRGTMAGTRGSSADLEDGIGPRRPQNRTEIDRQPLTVEVSYRRFVRGLPPDQRKAMQARLDKDSGVSLVGGPAWGEQ